MSTNYYDISETAALGCQFNLIFGERSNGKTTAALLKVITDYTNGLGNGLYVRQMDMDIKGQRGNNVMSSLRYGGADKTVNLISIVSDNKYDQVKYFSRAWYLGTSQSDDTVLWEKEPFCYAVALTNTKHDKSATPPRIKNVVFDEFIPIDGRYIADETVMFRQMLSTAIRDVDTVQVFLLANSISWNSPYFEMFEASKIVRQMELGETVQLTLKGATAETKVALEYCASTGGKKSDVYFTFADASTAMITSGKFAVPEYPKCPHHFTAKNVKATYWFELPNDEVIRARLMRVGRDMFVFVDGVERNVFESIADEHRDLFYSLDFSGKRNHYISPLQRYADSRTHYLVDAFATSRMFFATNELGEDLNYFVRTADAKSILAM